MLEADGEGGLGRALGDLLPRDRNLPDQLLLQPTQPLPSDRVS